MKRSIRFSKKLFGRIVTKQSAKYVTLAGLTFLGVSKGYRFYDEYAWKKEGIRRLKKHFFDRDRYVNIHGLDFLEYFFADYVTPMIHLEPKTMDEVLLTSLIFSLVSKNLKILQYVQNKDFIHSSGI